MEGESTLVAAVRRLQAQAPLPGASYYHVCFLGDENGEIIRTCTSGFGGWTDTKPRHEIREASLVDPEKMISLLKSIKEPGLLVNNQQDLFIFLLFGGHAVIEKETAEKAFPDLLAPRPVASSNKLGFVDLASIPPQLTQRAPSKKLRMKIFNRDHRRCRICGRSHQDYVDVELHLHHIRPWSQGGLTEEENLITLCKTCHDGLDPHVDWSLFELIGVLPFPMPPEGNSNWINGLRNYHKVSKQVYDKLENKKEKA